MLLGIDTGGTFTDFVLFQDGKLTVHKVLSTPKSPETAILQGISDLGLSVLFDSEKISSRTLLAIVHGSTVATNAVLERKGVRTVYVTNNGMADVLTIARQTRPELYALQGPIVIPPVEAALCLEVDTRTSANGEPTKPLTTLESDRICQEIIRLQPDAVAINFLFSYLNANDEILLASKLPETFFVSRSSAVLPEQKEYERGIATWLNSYVGPLVQGYLQRLQQKLPDVGISVMQSSGGSIDARLAGEQAVRMLLSGPAGGLAGAKYMADISACGSILTFDMGGTSTDVAMIDKEIQITTEGHIGEFPVAVPMVDMHTIGAGGGSIATIDSGGLLQVGPESAGADPGPACYGNKSKFATVTDANLVLGRLSATQSLAGNLTLDVEAGLAVISTLAESLSLDVYQTALGIIQIANEHMAQALRVMSVQRGLDPRTMSLVSFGGAGSLHVCALADSLSMTRALIPAYGGVLSAFGMLVAPKARYLSHSFTGLVCAINKKELIKQFNALEATGLAALEQEVVSKQDIVTTHELDLRYLGQSSFITIAIDIVSISQQQNDLSVPLELFHQQHRQRFGHQMDADVEVVNIRVTVKSQVALLEFQNDNQNQMTIPDVKKVTVYGFNEQIVSYQRDNLSLGQKISGPAIITEATSTIYIEANWMAELVAMGNLLLKKIEE